MVSQRAVPTDAELRKVAARHGLTLSDRPIRRNDAGLDFHVAHASDVRAREWVLRVPRRAGMGPSISAEGQILSFVARHLGVAVPDWQVHTEELIAYPLLPGRPGLTVEDGEPVWHLNPASPVYAEELGRLIAQLHAAPAADAPPAIVHTPAQVRDRWRADVERVRAGFDLHPRLLSRLEAWLADDGLWPEETVFTHGELYPAHVLIDDADRITAVLDWTTAKVDDPALDFMFQHAHSPPESFATTVRAYEEAGGSRWARLPDRCVALMSAGPVGYALYALTTGRDDHRATAQELLDADPG